MPGQVERGHWRADCSKVARRTARMRTAHLQIPNNSKCLQRVRFARENLRSRFSVFRENASDTLRGYCLCLAVWFLDEVHLGNL